MEGWQCTYGCGCVGNSVWVRLCEKKKGVEGKRRRGGRKGMLYRPRRPLSFFPSLSVDHTKPHTTIKREMEGEEDGRAREKRRSIFAEARMVCVRTCVRVWCWFW